MIRQVMAATAATALIALAGPAAAQAVYSIQSGPYGVVNNGGPCVVGPCSPYALTDTVAGTFTVPAPFAPNLTDYDFGPDLQAFNVDDGAVVFDSTNPRTRIAHAIVSTDGTGNITDYRIVLQVLHGTGATYPVNDVNDVEARFSYFLYDGGFAAVGRNNFVCVTRRADSAASGPGTCGSNIFGVDDVLDLSSRFTGGATPTTPILVSYTPPPPPLVVPTMTEWAMILFGLLLAGGAAVQLQRRRPAA